MLYPVVPGARPCRSRGRAAARGGTMSAEGQPAIFLGRSETSETLPLKFANRHGLIAGATGTGKTVTLQIMAEGLSQADRTSVVSGKRVSVLVAFCGRRIIKKN